MANRTTDRRALGWLAAGHVVNDMNQGAVPALLPFLIAERGLTYAAAGGVVLAATLLSSLIQPALGHLSDRRPLPFLIPLAVLAAGGGLALAGLVTSYGATVAAVLLSGAGVAAFHPESARYANYASGERRATGMSVFSVGGNLGIALGPVAIAFLAGSGGVARIVWMALPAGLMAALLARELPRLRPLRPDVSRSRAHPDADRPRWGAFARLSGVIVIRSLFAFGLVSFVPLYLVSVRGVPKQMAALAVTAMLLAGAVATLAGGRLADRFGRRAVLVSFLLPIAPLLAFFLHTPGVAGLASLVLIGGATVGTYSVAVVMGQEYLPGREGIAGGVTMGLAIGIGGIGVPLLGALADHRGVAAVFPVLGALPLLAAALSATLPGPRPALRREAPSAA
ncbi:MAG TPA: MFS transporter [Thermoanaerobaculia bacterium]|nr:MFS transporter [Thermoanaerobaculia bacterium]